MYGGVVDTSEGGECRVHVYEGSDTGVSWLPLWKLEDGECVRGKARPEGSEQMTAVVAGADICLTGELTETLRLTARTRLRALELNLL